MKRGGRELWLFLGLGFGLVQGEARADEIRRLYRNARVQAMGGAFVALADDESAIFRNPAGLAGFTRQTLHYFTTDLSFSHDIVISAMEGAEAFAKLNRDSVEAVLGKNIGLSLQVAPCFTTPGLGLAYLVEDELGLYSENLAYPDLTLGYQLTNGFQVAYGHSFGGVFRKAGGDFRIGFAAKLMWRKGGYHRVPISDFITKSKDEILAPFSETKRGIGVDIGAQYVRPISKNFTLNLGISQTDVGDTTFGDGPTPLKNNLAFGFAGIYRIGQIKMTGSYEYSDYMARTDWRKKNHIGFELSVPMLSVYAGVNQVYLSYGAGIDIWLLRLDVATYAEEQGSFVGQDPDRRYMLRLGMKFDL